MTPDFPRKSGIKSFPPAPSVESWLQANFSLLPPPSPMQVCRRRSLILLRCGRRGPPLRRRPSPPIPGRQIERKSPFFFPRPESRAIGGGGRGKGRISATPPPPPSGREEDDGKKTTTTVFPSCYPAPFFLLPFRASRKRERSREASHASRLPSFNPTEVRYSYKPLYRIYTFGRGCTPRSTVAPFFPSC